MIQIITIVWNSFKMALQELKVNKLRTFLSLFGITIGIFCIISVLATIDSLEGKIKGELKSFGSNTIYFDKWNYGNDQNYPWWKYIKRPEPKFEEMLFIKNKSSLAGNICFFASNNSNASYKDNELKNATIYSVTDGLNKIHDLTIGEGRYFGESDFERGTPVAVLGYEYATLLLGNANKAIGKTLTVGGKTVYIIGVLKQQGKSLMGGFDYEKAILLPYNYFASCYNIKYCNPFIMIQGKSNVPTASLQDELRGVIRQIRRLSPKAEDNFSLNDINEFGNVIGEFFGTVSFGGWLIAGLSLLVGAFGVANIMFVTVKERTSQIGLKKAIGAKKSTILTEFLLESAFLCIIGGLLGLLFVWLLAIAVSSTMPFAIVIAPKIVILALTICIVMGVLAGIVPASLAAKMDPVVAIRTK
jgi:putative ABC transport system permease protein